MKNIISVAFNDIIDGIRRHHVWIALANESVGDQYKRTTLGPMWLLVNYFLFAGTFIFLFRPSIGADKSYITYVAFGLAIFFYLMEVISQSVTLFVREQSFISGTRLPLFTYVMRLNMESAIHFAYAIVGALVLNCFGVGFALENLYSLAGLALFVLIAPAVVLVFAFLGAYMPDSQYIISNLMRVGMFITPVFWMPGNEAGIQKILYKWNPFTHFIAVIREPFFSHSFPLQSFLICLGIGVFFWCIAIICLGSLKRNLAMVI